MKGNHEIKHYADAEHILLFDLSNLAYISYHSAKNMEANGSPCGHVFGFFDRVYDLTMHRNFDSIGLVFARDGFPIRKKELSPEYKATRKPPEFDPKPDIYKLVKYLKCSVLKNEHEEADDLIAAFCYKNTAKNITIVSSDQDLWQLLELPHVKQWNPMKRKMVNGDDLWEKYGLTHFYNVVLWKSLFGDPGDNIKPPVMRLRKAPLVEIINKCNGSIRDFYRLLEENKHHWSSDVYDKIIDAKSGIETNGLLVDLDIEVIYDCIDHTGNRRFLDAFLKKFNIKHFSDEARILTGEEQ
jgi:5'-3' exonuclease